MKKFSFKAVTGATLLCVIVLAIIFSAIGLHHSCDHELCAICEFTRSSIGSIITPCFCLLGVTTVCFTALAYVSFDGKNYSLFSLKVKLSS